MKKIIAISLTVVLVAGCATYLPIVDRQGVDANRYNADLADCQQYATQVDPAAHAAAGAAVGAGLGAALGAIFGNRQTAGQGAAAYGLVGAAAGGAQGADSQMNIIRRCMSGRGYKVLQ